MCVGDSGFFAAMLIYSFFATSFKACLVPLVRSVPSVPFLLGLRGASGTVLVIGCLVGVVKSDIINLLFSTYIISKILFQFSAFFP
jgi:hypothetical protein